MATNVGEAPLFSIITVTFQALGPLQRTLKAIEAQTFGNYEHIVVDGASKDGTPQWLAGEAPAKVRWISEPDQGLYDAMNKGMDMARGKYLWFVNAGDLPEGPDVLARLAATADRDADILYGEVLMVTPEGGILGTRSAVTTRKLPRHLRWQDMRFGMVVSHQAFLPKRRIAPTYLTDNLCADIDWVIRCLKSAEKVTDTGLILARFETGGLSRQRHRRSLQDRFKVLARHFGVLPTALAHVWILCRAVWHKVLRGDRPYYG